MWDALVEFITKNANAIALLAVGALFGVLANKLAPWLLQRARSSGAALLALLSGRKQDYDFERRYLDWLIGRHRFLGQLPSNVAVATGEQAQLAELEQVYVALSVTPGGSAPSDEMRAQLPAGFLARRKPSWWMRFIPARFRRDEQRPHSDIGRAIEQHPRLVIRGDPGSGKTTMMKYLAVTCARALRNNAREGDSRKLVYERLGWKERPFPIFVSLGRHSRVTTWEKGRSLLDCCAEEFARELEGCPPGFFERRLKRGNCLILLDAFDELGSHVARDEMAQYVSGLLNRFPTARNRIVVTTRIVGYERQLDTRGFSVQTVQPLDDESIDALVRQRYRAIALNESRSRSSSEAELVQKRTAQKAEQLLVELRRNPRLHALAVNPLLLSLIVLDHSVKLVLPEERHILYRDCVEILAARWRQHGRAQLGLAATEDQDLTLSNKIAILQTIALTMQQQRTRSEAGQIPIRRAQAETLIAEQLARFLAAQLPTDPAARQVVCQQKATAWLDGIKIESGILVELGLDEAGEPVISFSHLTFQEYLAASALKEQQGLPALLLDNLLSPAWEEVVLLYVSMVQEATSIVQRLVSRATTQAGAWLVAGRCLTERATIADVERQTVLRGLHDLVRSGEESQRVRSCEVLTTIAAPTSIPVLVQVAEGDGVWAVRYVAAQALGRLGDPRFQRDEPQMVTVSAGEFTMGSEKYDREKPVHQVNLPEYCIGKHPVTNAEYKRFLDETGHPAPPRWEENNYPAGKANHPVVYVTWRDAQAYCQWLSQKTGKKYRLPTEAEWEKAARGPSTGAQDARDYPWGNEFDKAKCNTSESGIGTTTPVGIYLDGASPYGALDMAGNVWEWCSSRWGKDWQKPDFGYPYRADDGREDLQSNDLRMLRGGSWLNSRDNARCASRIGINPDNRLNFVGFRVAES
jgi:formylglycine-generating enzyme required for sulfatase activity